MLKESTSVTIGAAWERRMRTAAKGTLSYQLDFERRRFEWTNLRIAKLGLSVPPRSSEITDCASVVEIHLASVVPPSFC